MLFSKADAVKLFQDKLWIKSLLLIIQSYNTYNIDYVELSIWSFDLSLDALMWIIY